MPDGAVIMKMKVNGQSVEVFSGARVSDVLLKFSKEEFKLVQNSKKSVFDQYGHELDLEGELSEGAELIVGEKYKSGPCR